MGIGSCGYHWLGEIEGGYQPEILLTFGPQTLANGQAALMAYIEVRTACSVFGYSAPFAPPNTNYVDCLTTFVGASWIASYLELIPMNQEYFQATVTITGVNYS
jgi:hypothetical protein